VTSLSAAPPIVLEKFAVACCTAVNLKVCVIAWALAAVGSRTARCRRGQLPCRSLRWMREAHDVLRFWRESWLPGGANQCDDLLDAAVLRRAMGMWAQDMGRFS